MTSASTTVEPVIPAEIEYRPVTKKPKRKLSDVLLATYTGLVIAYLLIPIAVMILYSFNSNAASGTAVTPKVSFRWQGFTIEWWKQWNAVPDLTSSLWNSLYIAVISTIVATFLGTLIALALVRYHFRGSGTTETVMFMNIAAPEIVLGAALLSFFVLLRFPMGLISIFVAHVMFNIAFVAIVVRARLSGFHREIEEAAQDLYANAWVTFYKVTLPLIWPGILAGGLLAFALSIDDFVITYFNAGSTITFPLFVWGAARVALPPQINVIGTGIFVIAVGGMLVNIIFQNRRARRLSTG
jgi:spermidine/putrescine transport system permease protein